MTTETTLASIPFADLPALNTALDGGTFAGITTHADGTHCAVILLPNSADGLTWKQALAWAAEQGGELPSRPVAAMLFANVKSMLKPEAHWTHEAYGASSAWYCGFLSGSQHVDHKINSLSAVAVRLIPIAN